MANVFDPTTQQLVFKSQYLIENPIRVVKAYEHGTQIFDIDTTCDQQVRQHYYYNLELAYLFDIVAI